MDHAGFVEFLIWFAFDGATQTRNPLFADAAAWPAVAFATVSAFAFGAIVLVDFSVVMVIRIGFGSSRRGALGLRHGWVHFL